MYRVVTDITPHGSNRKLDCGPWHTSREEAEAWASVFEQIGYRVFVESQHPLQTDVQPKMVFL